MAVRHGNDPARRECARIFMGPGVAIITLNLARRGQRLDCAESSFVKRSASVPWPQQGSCAIAQPLHTRGLFSSARSLERTLRLSTPRRVEPLWLRPLDATVPKMSSVAPCVDAVLLGTRKPHPKGGAADQLPGSIQERHGVARDEAEKQLSAWQRSASDKWFAPKDKKPS
jgi:hypothetical protein